MSKADDGDLSALAYPGFVDILSSVIIMFVFFVLVVASALYFHIMIFKSKILSSVQETTIAQSEIKVQSTPSTPTQTEELKKENEELKEQIEEITQKMETMERVETENQTKLYQEKSQFAESEDQKIKVESQTRTLIVFFGEDSISLTAESTIELQQALSAYYENPPPDGYNIKVLAAKSPSTFETAARKLALARMLNVRNVLLEEVGDNDAIVPHVVTSEEIEGSHQWVKIIIEDKP